MIARNSESYIAIAVPGRVVGGVVGWKRMDQGMQEERRFLYTPTRYIIAWQLCVSWILDYPWIRLRGGGKGRKVQPTSPLVRQSVLYQGWPRARVNYFFPPPTPFPRLISTFSTFPLSLLLAQSSNSNINILTNLISFLFRILKFYLQFQTFLFFHLWQKNLWKKKKKREKKSFIQNIYRGITN